MMLCIVYVSPYIRLTKPFLILMLSNMQRKCISSLKGGFPLSEMVGEFVANSLRKCRQVEIDFVIVMVHCHLVNSFILSKIFLMRSYCLECSAKYFAAKK